MSKFKSKSRQAFLLSFFPDESAYAEKEVNGFILVKYFSNNTHEWEVMVYTEESFAERKKYLESVTARQVSNSEQTTIV